MLLVHEQLCSCQNGAGSCNLRRPAQEDISAEGEGLHTPKMDVRLRRWFIIVMFGICGDVQWVLDLSFAKNVGFLTWVVDHFPVELFVNIQWLIIGAKGLGENVNICDITLVCMCVNMDRAATITQVSARPSKGCNQLLSKAISFPWHQPSIRGALCATTAKAGELSIRMSTHDA